MAEQNGTKGAGIAKGGYKPKPFKNETGMDRLYTHIPHGIMVRIREISDRENSSIADVACHAITEYFNVLDGYAVAADPDEEEMPF